MWYVHTMQYCPTLKRKEILTQAIAWMNLKDIMLSEISHKRTNIVWFHLHEVSRISKLIDTESRIEFTKDRGEGRQKQGGKFKRNEFLRERTLLTDQSEKVAVEEEIKCIFLKTKVSHHFVSNN